MKVGVIVLLVLIGLYWLIDHAAPLPFNHEQFGLYNHTIHRVIGIVFLIAAGVAGWRMNKR
jgi:hypothetical protein